MRFRLLDRGNVAIGLGILAIVVAGTGTAVAVTASAVNIADPTTPARVAHVDVAGRLQVGGLDSSISLNGGFHNLGRSYITAETRASLIITDVALSETRLNGTANGSDMSVSVLQASVDASGGCDGVQRTLYTTTLSSGDHVELAGGSRLLVKPIDNTKYCLVIDSVILPGGSDQTAYYPTYTVTADVAAGQFTAPAGSARTQLGVKKASGH